MFPGRSVRRDARLARALAPVLLAAFALAACAGPAAAEPDGTDPPPSHHALEVVVHGDGHVSSSPSGLSCGEDCGATFEAGTVVTLQAEPSSGWSFVMWSDATCGASPACTIALDADATVEATMDEVAPVELALDLAPASVTIATGTQATLEAEVEGAAAKDLVWTASDGAIEGSGAQAVYTAPDEPGEYTVTVHVEGFPEISVSATVSVPGGLTEPFSMVVLPDTQNMIKDEQLSLLVNAMTDWIVDRRDALDIAFVTHVGDVVAFADDPDEWARADAALSVLDGVVPYSVALGDHEYETEEDKGSSVEGYLAHFGAERYAEYAWYGGTAPNGLSHWQIFEAGGRTFLHIALEWEPPGPASDPSTPLGWARTVLEAHPGMPTVLTTHAYLWDKAGDEGRFPDGAREGYVMDGESMAFVGSSGETIFEELVAPYPQVFMVLNGHYHKRASDDPDEGEYHQVSTNDAGLPVYEMLSNYQSWTDGGEGWLRLLEFRPGGGAGGLDRIVVRTYSPPLDAYQEDTGSAFAFDLSFAERFAD